MTRPLQVYIEEEELVRLEAWSKKRGWTKSQTVRAAVRALTKPPGTDPLLDASGMVEGLPPDLSARFDRYLENTFVVTPASRKAGNRQSTRARLRR